MNRIRAGVVAPSSAVGRVELANGVARLRAAGLDVTVHPGATDLHYTFAGTDEARAGALYEYAKGDFDVIWAAGGGYGATRLLPRLDELTLRGGVPGRKLLVGYSDVTALHEYTRTRWGWETLHFPMPSAGSFPGIESRWFDAAIQFVRGERPAGEPWLRGPLRFLTEPPEQAVRGTLVGGNMSLWAAMAGTRYVPHHVEGGILFLEDIGEAPYRIDRMAVQIEQADAFDGLGAIVLGDFTNCADDVSQVLAAAGSTEKVPLRPKIEIEQALVETFGRIGREHGIVVAAGLAVGHGPNFAPLPLGAEYELMPAGELRLVHWSRLDGSSAV